MTNSELAINNHTDQLMKYNQWLWQAFRKYKECNAICWCGKDIVYEEKIDIELGRVRFCCCCLSDCSNIFLWILKWGGKTNFIWDKLKSNLL